MLFPGSVGKLQGQRSYADLVTRHIRRGHSRTRFRKGSFERDYASPCRSWDSDWFEAGDLERDARPPAGLNQSNLWFCPDGTRAAANGFEVQLMDPRP